MTPTATVIHGTPGAPVTPVSPVAPASLNNTHRTHGTQDNHITCYTYNNNGTHDISGKVPEGTHCRPEVPDVGSSTLVGQPKNMSPVTPSGLTQKKKGVAGRIWRCIFKYLCYGLPSKRANTKVIKETANG